MLPFRLSIDAHAIIRLLLLRLMIKVHTDRVVFINVWIAGDGKRARIDGSASIDHRAFRRLITGTDSVDKSFSLRPSFFFIRISHRGDVVFLPGLFSRGEKKKKKKQGNRGFPDVNIYFELVERFVRKRILKRMRGCRVNFSVSRKYSILRKARLKR